MKMEMKMKMEMEMEMMINRMLTAYRSLRPFWSRLFLWLLLASLLDLGLAWKCQYKEFPVDEDRIGGLWYIYGSLPQPMNRCMVKELDMYWNRIVFTDYNNVAVELHCSLPWYIQQKVIYTRHQFPDNAVISRVDSYLNGVGLKSSDFHIVNQLECEVEEEELEPLQRWHLSKYSYVGYHEHYVQPLSIDENI